MACTEEDDMNRANAGRLSGQRQNHSATINLSPRRVPVLSSVPAGNSTTAYARSAPAIRHGGTAAQSFTTRPSFETNATSIAKRMKNV